MAELTQARLKELLHYDPDTGKFTALQTLPHNRKKAGSQVGFSTGPEVYRAIRVDGRSILEHRLAFLYMCGTVPNQVDHINGVRDDNRWVNLRESDHSLNAQNQRKNRKSKSGILGVYYGRASYFSSININGKKIYLGSFPTADEAFSAYLQAKRHLHPACTI